MLTAATLGLLLIGVSVFAAQVWRRPNPNHVLIFDLLQSLPREAAVATSHDTAAGETSK